MMKRIDYFWPRAVWQVTGIVFLSQIITEIIGQRNDGYEWVLPVSAGLFVLSCCWVLCVVIMNALGKRDET